MKVKQIAWGVSPQAARLIYTHMVHTQVRTCGKRPTRDEKVLMEAMGTMGKGTRNKTVQWGPWEKGRVTKTVQWEHSHPSHAPAQVVAPCHAS